MTKTDKLTDATFVTRAIKKKNKDQCYIRNQNLQNKMNSQTEMVRWFTKLNITSSKITFQSSVTIRWNQHNTESLTHGLS